MLRNSIRYCHNVLDLKDVNCVVNVNAQKYVRRGHSTALLIVECMS